MKRKQPERKERVLTSFFFLSISDLLILLRFARHPVDLTSNNSLTNQNHGSLPGGTYYAALTSNQ